MDGSLLIENRSHATLSWVAKISESESPRISIRSDLVAFDPSTGRGSIQIANGFANNFADSLTLYVANPGEGFFLDTTAGRFNRGIAGALDALGTE